MGLTLSDTINAIDYGSLTLVYKCPCIHYSRVNVDCYNVCATNSSVTCTHTQNPLMN